MTMPMQFDFAEGTALAVEITDIGDLPSAVDALGLRPPRPTVVIVGGAGGLDSSYSDRLRDTFESGIVPVLQRHRAVAVDGGTDAGVMRLGGRARAVVGASYPLVGVVAAGTVRIPGRAAPSDAEALESNHSHFVLVPGDTWGAEVPWISRTAAVLAGDRQTVTVLINGGKIAIDDVEHSVRDHRRVIAVAGSGRTADAVAAAAAGHSSDERLQRLIASGLVTSVSIADPKGLADLLDSTLGEDPAR